MHIEKKKNKQKHTIDADKNLQKEVREQPP